MGMPELATSATASKNNNELHRGLMGIDGTRASVKVRLIVKLDADALKVFSQAARTQVMKVNSAMKHQMRLFPKAEMESGDVEECSDCRLPYSLVYYLYTKLPAAQREKFRF